MNGALPGIVMMANPAVGGAAYLQEYRPGVAEDMAKVVQTGATAQVPAGSYTKLVVTEDTDPLDPGKLEQFVFRVIPFTSTREKNVRAMYRALP